MKASPLTKVRTLYDDTAESYAQMMDAEIELPVYADTLGRLAARISGIDGPVVDTSCGSGHMLARYREQYDPGRALTGIDISPRMVALAGKLLGEEVTTLFGDMRDLPEIKSGTAAGVISFFALHHLDPEDAIRALREWSRILVSGGQLVVAVWEGTGSIDYGEESDVVAFRYTREELTSWAQRAGFSVDRCNTEPVDGFPMDAVYLEGTK